MILYDRPKRHRHTPVNPNHRVGEYVIDLRSNQRVRITSAYLDVDGDSVCFDARFPDGKSRCRNEHDVRSLALIEMIALWWEQKITGGNFPSKVELKYAVKSTYKKFLGTKDVKLAVKTAYLALLLLLILVDPLAGLEELLEDEKA